MREQSTAPKYPFHLTTSSSLSLTRTTKSGSLSYQANVPALQADNNAREFQFTYTFTKKAYLAAYPKAILYMSCPAHKCSDVYMQLRKATTSETLIQNLKIPLRSPPGFETADKITCVRPYFYLSPSGALRASRQASDAGLSKPPYSIYTHTRARARKNPKKFVTSRQRCWS
jgi:hypothetical protein